MNPEATSRTRGEQAAKKLILDPPDGKAQQRRIRQFKMLEPAVRESDVYGSLRLGSIPALPCGDLAEQAAYQFARPRSVFEMQKQIASQRQVVATQNKALNISLVEFTHCDRPS